MNLQNIQKMQQRLLKLQEELEATRFTGTAGGGAVTVVINGKFEMLSIKIDPDAFSAEDIGELEAMVLAASKNGFDKATQAQQKLLSAATGGMRIPGLF
jgi:DNA-binding YbaB/EbfC family protein